MYHNMLAARKGSHHNDKVSSQLKPNSMFFLGFFFCIAVVLNVIFSHFYNEKFVTLLYDCLPYHRMEFYAPLQISRPGGLVSKMENKV